MSNEADDFLRSMGIPLLKDEEPEPAESMSAVDEETLSDGSESDGVLDEHSAHILDRVNEVTTQLGTKRTTFRAEDGTVEVVVDGNARLQEIIIAKGAHRQPHPERLAEALLDVLGRAREHTRSRNAFRVEQALGDASSSTTGRG